MPLYRVMCSVESGNDLTIDDAVNTFYLQDIGPTTDAENLCQDAATLWATYRNYPTEVTRITAKIYNMDEPEPRNPLYTKTAAPGSAGQGGGPREVALCLSFYATTNVPRRRGRLYLGPWHQNAAGLLRPADVSMAQLGTLSAGLQGLGGVDVDWMQYSPTNNLANKVTNWWVDNEWDTMRSRGLRGTSRISGTTSEQMARGTIYDGVRCASWIVPHLRWARANGWTGRVISGHRSRALQQRLYDEWRRGERAGPVARPGTSNHEGLRYPRGAVDVTNGEQLAGVLQERHGPGRPLRWFGAGDVPHFSATGR